MQQALSHGAQAPILEINTTPLIDVLLVLLIMFIITIPLQSHAVKLDLPGKPPIVMPQPIRNTIVITTAGQVLWNGVPISMDGLRHNLGVTQRMVPTPELHLQPEPDARYELVDQVLAVTKRAQVDKMGFVGNERYATF